MKKTCSFWGVSWVALCIAAAPAAAQEKGGLDLTGPYDVVVDWFKPGIDGWNQRVVSVNAEDPNRVFIGAVDRNDTREGHPMLSADGKVMKAKTTVVRDNNNFDKGDVNNIMNVIGPLVLIGKVMILSFIIFWVRFTFPRFREDQLQKIAWKYLIPLSLINIAATAILKVAF